MGFAYFFTRIFSLVFSDIEKTKSPIGEKSGEAE